MKSRVIFDAVQERFFQGKVLVLTGPRQVGKTTLLKQLVAASPEPALWLNADEPDVREQLSAAGSIQLQNILGNHRLLLIDEAQRVKNIGLVLKLLADQFPQVQVVATGSSSFELGNEINEPLTGRKWEYQLYPFSTEELENHHGQLTERRNLEQRLIYGSYPDVVNHPADAVDRLMELTQNYLYKDLLGLELMRKPLLLEKLLQALALQLGQEVSFHELGQLLGTEHRTVEKYLQLLEKCYIVFTLPALSRNLRNELKKGRKVYFVDNGVRNAIIKNFNPLALRTDTGALWENFIISERRKWLHYHRQWVNSYFWRTHSQQEIDLIEEHGGRMHAFECKWSPRKAAKMPASFAQAYPENDFQLINADNYFGFVGKSARL